MMQRWNCYQQYHQPHSQGHWVTFADHQAEMTECRRERELKEERYQQLCEQLATKDEELAAADKSIRLLLDELRDVKAELSKKNEELEQYAWSISPAMAQAKIDQLHADLSRVIGMAESIAMMATSFSAEEYPVLVREAREFLDDPAVKARRKEQV